MHLSPYELMLYSCTLCSASASDVLEAHKAPLFLLLFGLIVSSCAAGIGRKQGLCGALVQIELKTFSY